jgi:hypothetical protein
MRHDPASRVLSLSFTRDPAEHADVMIAAGRRMFPVRRSSSLRWSWIRFSLAIAAGIVIGFIMEAYRRLVLPFLGMQDTVPLGTAMLQVLPLALLAVALLIAFAWWGIRLRRSAFAARISPGVIVDVDIFTDGLTSSGGDLIIDLDWLAVREVYADANRIEIECESFVVYLPVRAFADGKAFTHGAAEIRKLWRDRLKRDRDRRLLGAGVD